MTYDTQKLKYGRRPVQYAEIALDRCVNTYGTAPCTAVLGIGGTGLKKCYNTRATCQDTANFRCRSTNYVRRNRDLEHSAWTKTGVTAANEAAVSLWDGTWNGMPTITEDSSTGLHQIEQSVQGITLVNGNPYTFRMLVWSFAANRSVYVKLEFSTGTNKEFIVNVSTLGVTAIDDAAGVTVNNLAAPGVTYFEIVVNITPGTITGTPKIKIGMGQNAGSTTISYTGGGSAAIGVELMSLEEGTYSTGPYAPTLDAAVEAVNTTRYRFSSQDIPFLRTGGDDARSNSILSRTEVQAVPALIEVDTAPSVLDPGRGLGVRASLSVTVSDSKHNDQNVDPYISSRDYVANAQGTLWGRLLARNLHIENRRIDLYTGYLTDAGIYDALNFRKRTFFISNVRGPDENGAVVISGRDPIRYADAEKTQVPLPTEGKLNADINSSVTSIVLQSGGVTTGEYAVDDYVRIDKEIMKISALNSGTDTLTVTRALMPTWYAAGTNVADSHKAGAIVQRCQLYDGVRVDEVVYDLLVTRAGIDPSFVDFASWEAIADDWLAAHTYSTLITEPTAVKDLLVEISSHIVMIWWDERDQLVKFDAIHPITDTASVPTFNDEENLIKGSVGVTRDSSKRLSQVWIYFGQRSPIEKLDKKENYASIFVQADGDAESPDEYKFPAIRAVYSRWLPLSQESVAQEIGSRMLAFYRNTKKLIAFRLDAKDDSFWTGDPVKVTTRLIQDTEGVPEEIGCLILQTREVIEDGMPLFEYLAMDIQDVFRRYAVIAPDEDPPATPFPDYLLATVEQRNYAFICDDDGFMSNGDAGYLIN